MKMNSKLVKGIFILAAIFVVISLMSPKKKEDQSMSTNQQTQGQANNEQNLPLKLHDTEIVGSVLNLAFLITDPAFINEDNMKKANTAVLEKNCKEKKCNISYFDDEKAAMLEQEYSAIMSSSSINAMTQATEWKKTNYVYVADHLVAQVTFSAPTLVNMYPYKDWYYKELKGEK